jgi:prepilin-type processing-associated H-X9-DG protein
MSLPKRQGFTLVLDEAANSLLHGTGGRLQRHQPDRRLQRSHQLDDPRDADHLVPLSLHNCAQGGCYSHINVPNTQACFFSDETSSHTYYTIVGTSSNHPGGVNVGFIDGSVRFVKNSVSQTTWWGIATKSGGEVISADSY